MVTINTWRHLIPPHLSGLRIIRRAHIVPTLALVLLGIATSAIPALEAESDVAIWPSAIPDAAQRSHDRPILLARVSDPTVGVDYGLVIQLALAMAQDGDKGVSGVISFGSGGTYALVDAVSPAGVSRQEQAISTVAQAWPKKSGDAWLMTWRTLRGRNVLPTPESIAALPASLVQASTEVRHRLLADSDTWAGWGSPALTAILLGALDVPAADYSDHDVRGHLLRRLYETDMVSGRNRIFTAIKANDETIRTSALLLLPDESLPELDEAFRKALRGVTSWNAICCASRYGSPAILEDIRTVYQSSAGRWACDLSTSMLRYLMKHDRAAGLRLVREAMGMRDRTGCYRTLLPDVLPSFPGADTDQLIDEFILDTNDDVAQQALRAISLLPGTPARLRSILDRLGPKLSDVVRKDVETRLEQAK